MKPYQGWNHPRWRNNEYLDIDPVVRADFENDIRSLLLLYPEDMRKVDIEMVGSRARGNVWNRSDVDIIFTTGKDDVDTANRAYWLKNRHDDVVHQLELKWQVGIDVCFGISAKKKNMCYSFNDQKYYGRNKGEKSETKCVYSLNTKQYEPQAIPRSFINGCPPGFHTTEPDPWQP